MFADNEVVRLDPSVFALGRLGAISWIADTSPQARQATLRAAISAIEDHVLGVESWLFVGDTASQPDNRVTRYLGLWKSLANGKCELPRGKRTRDYSVKFDDGIRWFGGIRIEPGNLVVSARLLDERRATAIITMPHVEDHEIERLVAAGWSEPLFGPPPQIVKWAIARLGVVHYPVGWFDDPDRGVVSLGRPDLLNAIPIDKWPCV